MSQKITAAIGKKGNSLLRALVDLLILALLLAGAGFGGYFWGIHQQLAPVLKVPPGTPGALLPNQAVSQPAASNAGAQKSNSATGGSSAQPEDTAAATTSTAKAHGKKKFWIVSSGVDYIGYSITVKVNDTTVDNFFGPGKSVDITRLVKAGENTLECDAKELGEQYQKHAGDAKSKLTLQLVSGSHITDNFKKSDVLLTYGRTAADTEDATDTLHFSGD